MKQTLTKALAFIAIFLASFLQLNAQGWWTLAVMEDGWDRPAVKLYYGMSEKAADGTEYLRIYDKSIRVEDGTYPGVKLRYGYRTADRQIYVYDFETEKETLAFDFSLSPGDCFTTFNGVEWKVESARDTLMNITWRNLGPSVKKRLLTVKSADGKHTDQWLEDFGSFTNHLMIGGLEHLKCGQALWMDYDDSGDVFAREISADPFYAHDSGWLDAAAAGDEPDEFFKCEYKDGAVVFEDVRWAWEHRGYSCYWREGDDIYRIYSDELIPHIDGGDKALRSDVATFAGVPAPVSGAYTIHVNGNTYTTGIGGVGMTSQPAGHCYDLSGRRLKSQPENGTYIKDGKKTVARCRH